MNQIIICLNRKVTDLKILICDDDKETVDEIREHLNAFSQKHKIVFEMEAFCSRDAAAKDAVYDMAFIDIEMPEINGLALTSLLKEKNRNIIIFIVTSYECYLDDAMDLEVFRYISKPIDTDRFYRALKTAVQYYHTNTQIVTLEYYDEFYTVFTRDILYITTEGKYAVVVTRQKKYLTNQRIGYWKNKLRDIEYFVQTHYSFIVNMRYITDFKKAELHIEADCKKIVLPISQRRYSSFKKLYFSYMGV